MADRTKHPHSYRNFGPIDFDLAENHLLGLETIHPMPDEIWAYYDPVTVRWLCLASRVCRVKVRVGFNKFFKTYAYFQPGETVLIADRGYGQTILSDEEIKTDNARLRPLHSNESIDTYQVFKGGKWLIWPRIEGV